MADATYINQAVYHQQEGDVLVVASGGELLVESGGVVTTESGGGLTVESGGNITVESGGIIDIEDGGYFGLEGMDVTADQLRNALYVPLQKQTVTATSTVGTSFANSQLNLLSGYGLVIFSVTSNHINNSFWLTSTVVGREVILQARIGSTTGGSAVIWVSTSGCSLVNIWGNTISGFFIRTSSNSMCLVKLRCFNSNEWSVIQTDGNYAEA